MIRRRVASRPAKPVAESSADGIPSEHVEQRNFVRWFRFQYPGVRIFAIPNGEARSRTSGARLKAEGVSAGVPDLYIPAWKVWIEMKRRKGGSVSDKQADWHQYLRSVGDSVFVCRGMDEAVAACQSMRSEKNIT